MLMYAAIVLPRSVADEVAGVVRSVQTAAEPPAAPKGLLSRLGGRRGRDTGPASVAPDELELIAPEQMSLPITGFGNVTTGDALRLAETLREAAATWTRPTLHLTGGGALEFPDDRCVWARLAGDVASLSAVARGVTQGVEPLGFFVDRRKFRPLLAVATVTDHTTTDYLQSVLDALDAFRGEDWTVDYVSLTRRSFDAVTPRAEEVDRIPIPRPGRHSA